MGIYIFFTISMSITYIATVIFIRSIFEPLIERSDDNKKDN